ncbi:MAG: acyl-CoA thioesterase [Myxococcales bacterium]|nr:acyl-CoA thioesterase [Myxococcales bacterium]
MRHALTVVAQPEDIDDLGHVSNQVYLRWVLDIAVAHSTVLGWDAAAYQRLGAGWVVRRHELDYLAQVRVGDEVTIETWVDTWKGVSCVRRTAMRRARDGAEVLRAATTWAFIDFTSGRPRKIPDEIRALFADAIVAG